MDLKLEQVHYEGLQHGKRSLVTHGAFRLRDDVVSFGAHPVRSSQQPVIFEIIRFLNHTS